MHSFPDNFISVSHWGMYLSDDMALERATDILFETIYHKRGITFSKRWRDMEWLMRRCIGAYQCTNELDAGIWRV